MPYFDLVRTLATMMQGPCEIGVRLLPGLLALIGISALWLTGCTVQPGELNLRDSFAAQIAAVEGVADFEDNGDELTFTGPDGQDSTSDWRVEISSAMLEPQADDRAPYAGHIVSSWYLNSEPIDFVGTISGLPQVYLDAGVAQECYALWDPTISAWDW